jgi:hypothetical protein
MFSIIQPVHIGFVVLGSQHCWVPLSVVIDLLTWLDRSLGTFMIHPLEMFVKGFRFIDLGLFILSSFRFSLPLYGSRFFVYYRSAFRRDPAFSGATGADYTCFDFPVKSIRR